MNFKYSPQFKRNLRKLPFQVQEKFYRQAELLSKDIRHPSLHAKKFDEQQDLWQARVDRNVRFYFTMKEDTYYLVSIRRHAK